jgi:uncharacterized damage-inducible protein DinB
MRRPSQSEYFEYYARYVNLVREGDIIDLMGQEMQRTLDMLADVPEDLEGHRYEPGKWSIKEVVGHVIDAERLFGYRALHFARRDPAPLPSMDENEWARVSNADTRSLHSLAVEFELVRRSHMALFAGFDEEMSVLTGMASGYEFTVRTLPYIMVGHEMHHRSVLADRYLGMRWS